MKLAQISLENFKSHRESSFELKPITIFIGPNSCGKSSILQSLLMLKNTLHPHGASSNQYLASKTDSYDFGDFDDIVTNGASNNLISIQIKGSKSLQTGLINDVPTSSEFLYQARFGSRGIHDVIFQCFIDDFKIDFHSWSRGSATSKVVNQKNQEEISMGTAQLYGIHPRMTTANQSSEITKRFNSFFINGNYTETLLDQLFYIPFNRTATNYGVVLRRPPDELISTNPINMMSFMFSKLSKEPKLLDEVSRLIQDIFGKSIRTRNIDIGSSDQGVTIDFVRKGVSNSIVNEGTGMNQVVLLLTILANSPDNAIITIDEPEIHLHPQAQSKLAKIMIDMAKSESKQILLTTHSEHMIYPFLASVASKKKHSLARKDLAIYYLQLDDETGTTKYEKLRVNKSGQLKGGLKGFWDVDLQTFSDFLEIQNEE